MTNYFEIDFLKLNSKKSGDAIVIRYCIDGDSTIHVVDGGFQQDGESLKTHIDTHYDGPTRIDHVVVTHNDQDHAGGLRHILEEYDIGTLWMLRPWEHVNVSDFSYYKNEENLKKALKEEFSNLSELEKIAFEKGIQIREPFQGVKIGQFTVLAPSKKLYKQLVLKSDKSPQTVKEKQSIGESLEALIKKGSSLFTVLWGHEKFSSSETSTENEMSVVQFAKIHGRKIVLTGDSGRQGLTEAVDFAYKQDLGLPGVNLFHVPHHGSGRNISAEILDRFLGPKLDKQFDKGQGTFSAVICASSDDQHHPKMAVKRAVQHRGANIITTKENTYRCSYNSPDQENWSPVVYDDYPTETEYE